MCLKKLDFLIPLNFMGLGCLTPLHSFEKPNHKEKNITENLLASAPM